MTADDSTDPGEGDTDGTNDIEPADVRAELDRQRTGGAGARTRRTDGIEEFDEGLVDLLSWALDTDTRARIYVQLRRRPFATNEEVAEGTGLYPSTVREALAELHEEGVVERHERAEDANDAEYTAIAPSALVGEMADRVRDEFESLFGLDRLRGDRPSETTRRTERTDPVTITVEEADDGTADDSDGDDGTDEQ